MQFVRYVLVQVLAYGVDMGAFIVLLQSLDLDPLVANLIGKILAGLFAFAVHRSFTFGLDKAGTLQQAVRYFTLLALNIPLSAAVLAAMLWVIPLAIVSKLAADVVCVFLTYWLTKRFVFLRGNSIADSTADGQGLK